MTGRWLVAGCTAAVLLAAGACDIDVAASPESMKLDDELAAIDPCDLLIADELDQLELPAGVPAKSEPADLLGEAEGDHEPEPLCEWDNPDRRGARTSAQLVLSGGLDHFQPLADPVMDLADIEDIEFGDRRARRVIVGEWGHCRIDLAVGDHAMVIVNVLLMKPLGKPCELADAMVELIEPRLPG